MEPSRPVSNRPDFAVDVLAANGVDATTGCYLAADLTKQGIAESVRRAADGSAVDPALLARHRRAAEPTFAPRFGVDPDDLAQAGWGVVIASDTDPSVYAALRPLLKHRRTQAAAVAESRYREFTGPEGYRPPESKQQFLRRHGSGPGPVDPDVVPYYLLLVGGPDEIPFSVQHQLAAQHAVGRLSFPDPESYARYAENVVAAETTRRLRHPLRLNLFGPRHDRASKLSVDLLVNPLADALSAESDRWRTTRNVATDATKEVLVNCLSGPDRPDILLTVSHGIGFPSGHPDQIAAQGALICQDWPGPGHGPVQPGHLFRAADVAALPDADLTGMVALLFACFGAGTPAVDGFPAGPEPSRPLAPVPFVAALPQALLGRPGGALAVIGHVDRAWSYSFRWPGVGRQTEVFRSTLARLGAGQRVGHAFEVLADRHAELATELGDAFQDLQRGRRLADDALSELWTAYADARGYLVLGDPAVRISGSPEEIR